MNQISISSANYEADFAVKTQTPYVDLKATFCDSYKCSRYKNGKWLYFDTGHLSISGAEALYSRTLDALEI